VDWASRTTAWSRSGDELFFVDWPDVMVIRRYRTNAPAADPPFAKTAVGDAYLRDLYVSSETGRLGYISGVTGLVTIHELDPATDAVREIARFKGAERGQGIAGRGWLSRQFVVLRTVRANDDGTGDVEVLVTSDNGVVRVIATVTKAYSSTARLHPSERAIYLTRAEKGTENVYVLSLASGILTQVTQNTCPASSFQDSSRRDRVASSASVKNGAKTSGSFSRQQHRGPAIRPAAESLILETQTPDKRSIRWPSGKRETG
jgi:hypothetical protein